MATVTMNDIMKKIKDNGLEGKVHARDLVLGGKNPELLNRIVDSKIGWMNAKSDAERGLYAAEAKAIRASQGYQLSDDGSRDVTNDMLGGKATGAGALRIGNPASRKSSSDNPANSAGAAFENYRATLEAAQKKAQEDALGKVAALTGGYGSSSAAIAATAAGADYSKLLADKELELAENERQRALTAEQQDYQRKLEKAQLAASVGDYSLYEQMGIDMTALREKEKADAEAAAAAAAEASAQKERSTYEQLLADAETAAKYGDTSQLRALGIDTRQYDSKFAGSATQKNAGGAGSSAKTVSADFQTDPSAALYAAGAETFNQAYALLLSNGYSSTAATTIAENYLAELDDMAEENDIGTGDTDAPPAQTGSAGGKTRPASELKAYAADVADARKQSMANAKALLVNWLDKGTVTPEEAVLLAKQSSNGLADALLRELVANAQITADEANALARKYRIE